MPSQTIAPTVKAALQTLLAARSGLSGVQINYGHPWQPNADYIALTNIRHTQRPAAIKSAAPRPTEEEFEMEVVCASIRKGEAEHQASTERAYALAAEVEDAIRTDLTISSTITDGWALVTALELEERGPDEADTRESVVTVTVTVRARI